MALFDHYSESYGNEVESAVAFAGRSHDFYLKTKADRFLEMLAEEGGVGENPLILDLGCGVGDLHSHVPRSAGRLVGVDPSIPSLSVANCRSERGDYFAGSGFALPFRDESFHAVLAVCVLHHVDSSRRSPFVREMARVLRPGGVAVVFEHNPYHPLTRLAVSRCPFDEGVRLLSPRDVGLLLSNAGLQRSKSRHLLFTPFSGRPFEALDRWLGRLPFGAQYYSAARKSRRRFRRDVSF